ncbi:hypothetical protein GCM10025872_29720 [Barrientosiimonas endolithica]|uniref:Uncharacterized protein n=1 Tax=Barrientosiimonas endolithica TaxID=1535208 RepID=A0ABM8HEA2_9MICO|nr:hypothetical protein GCM10025872_29720 [Barrientosiimonas endolithica]
MLRVACVLKLVNDHEPPSCAQVLCDGGCGLSDLKREWDEFAISDLVLSHSELLASGTDENGVAVSDETPESPNYGERKRVERHDVHLGSASAENFSCARGYARH